MKFISSGIITAFCLFISTLSAQDVTLTVAPTGCAETATISLMEFDGFTFFPLETQELKDNKAIFTLPQTEPRIYYIGTDSGNMLPVILGSEEEVTLAPPCNKFRSTNVSFSPINKSYKDIKGRIQTFKNSAKSMQRQVLQATGDATKQEKALFGLQQIDKQRLDLLNSTKEKEPFLGAVVELNTYLSYQWYGEGFNDELNYFVNMYFNYANWESAHYHYNPWVYESTKAYVQTLSKINIPSDQHAMAVNMVLSKIPKDSRTYRLAYGGFLAGMEAAKHDNYAYFAQKFIEEHGDKDKETAAKLQEKLDRVGQLMVGGTAPDFTQNTPEGQPLNLSDLRGKVVLLDFWASWCGPCRKENPNVVKAYQEYKDKGFDILSVSLDKDKARWLAAIEKDNMTWHHVSDLQGWRNAVAKMYGVSSIPATILLDKDGKIIARNLRGPALDARLKKIFKE